MNPFFEYLIKSTLSLALFYIVFKLAVSRDKMHTSNRFVLLAILLGSALLPFANIPLIQQSEIIPKVEVFRELVAQPVFSAPVISENVQSVPLTRSFEINWFLTFYLSIISVLFIRLLISIKRVLQIIRTAEKQSFHKVILAVVKDFIQPFTFLKNIVISEKDYAENREIVVTHEYAHIKNLHSIDLMFCELFAVLHFFNPFMWLLRRELKLIHEYQADQAVLNKGIDATKYQLLVLQKSVGERRFAMANHFTQRPILKRIKMMQKKNKSRWNWVKLILFAPLILLLLQAFARPELLIEKASEFVPVIQQDETTKWMEKWTKENIGEEFFQPEMQLSEIALKENNVLVVLLNRKSEFLIENQFAKKEEVKQIVKEFLKGKSPYGKKGPDFVEKEIQSLGKTKVSNGVVKFQHDMDTPDETVNFTLKSIGEAFLESRKEMAKNLFDKDYFALELSKSNAIDEAIPIRFLIVEPKFTKIAPPPILISISENGEYFIMNDKYSLAELEKKLSEIEQKFRNNNQVQGTDYPLIVQVKVAEGITDKQVSQLKEALRKAKTQHVNYSTEYSEADWKNLSSPALKSNYIRINNIYHPAESAILGNESTQRTGKFEFDVFPPQFGKDIAIYFLSLKSESLETPSKGTYIFESRSFSERENYTFWGKVSIDKKELAILNGKLEILNNSIRNFKAIYNVVLEDGTKISGQYNGVVAYNDWKRLDIN